MKEPPCDTRSLPASVVARRVIVRGRVQGVFFRACTRDEARHLEIQGWVRNLPGGEVEAWVQGQPQAIEAMLDWFPEGSPASRVTDVSVEIVEAEPQHEECRIRR